MITLLAVAPPASAYVAPSCRDRVDRLHYTADPDETITFRPAIGCTHVRWWDDTGASAMDGVSVTVDGRPLRGVTDGGERGQELSYGREVTVRVIGGPTANPIVLEFIDQTLRGSGERLGAFYEIDVVG